MQAVLRRTSRLLQFTAAVLPLVGLATPAPADIYTWEYINPADPSQGKRQSTTLAPGGAGVDAVPGAELSGRNLTMAYLHGADLSGANLTNWSEGFTRFTYLTDADLSGANLTNANFAGAYLRNATFTGAEIRGARFVETTYYDSQVNYFLGRLTPAQLYSTASFQARDLTGISLANMPLIGVDFSNQNLSGASLNLVDLTGADFTDAEVRGATFQKGNRVSDVRIGTGISLNQLYSTASYRARDLTGIRLLLNDLSNGNFTGQNLTNADFRDATLARADFTGADIRGARFGSLRLVTPGISLEQFYSTANYQRRDLRGVFFGILYGDLSQADTANVILPGGHINGLELIEDEELVVSDYEGHAHATLDVVAIKVDQRLAMGPGGTLRMVFETDAWDSTISFATGIPVTLGGTLELTFAADVNPATQLGRTFDLFDWTGVTPTGAFAVSSPYRWDLSNLYTTGQVTLTAIPEPAALLVALAALFLTPRRAAR
jgi:uncharacterized protein YjbI with pentapeptide repeats